MPGLGNRAFDISGAFNWSAWYGEIIQGVLNVTPHPTVLQLICWLAYIVVVLALFLRPTRPPAPKPAPATDVSPENADASEESERSPPLTERPISDADPRHQDRYCRCRGDSGRSLHGRLHRQREQVRGFEHQGGVRDHRQRLRHRMQAVGHAGPPPGRAPS